MNPLTNYWYKKLRRLGFHIERVLDDDDGIEADEDQCWGFEIFADCETGNCGHRAYTQIEAHLVSARLLAVGADPDAWVTFVQQVGDRDEYDVHLVWFNPDNDEEPCAHCTERLTGHDPECPTLRPIPKGAN